MTTMTDLALTSTRTIAAPPARVFDAWLDAEMLARFMTPMRDMPAPKVSNDPRQGGRFDIVMMAGDKEIPHWGTYEQISPHSRIVFTWNSPFSVEGSTVTLDFAPDGDGTLVKLTHVKFPSEESRDNHDKGWAHILTCLDQTLA